tara:strand:- start:211 stop:1176 length:966 start_codon:yes stop_codon:yes gene_type:complete
MKTFIFIPDTNKKAGLGHLYRCFKYSNFINQKYEIIFLINKNFDKTYLIKKNYQNIKIKYVFFSSITSTLNMLYLKYQNIITFLDTYNSKIRNINFKKFSKKHINILDYKVACKADFIIDHTFNRKIDYHKINIIKKISIGHQNFPVYKKVIFSDRKLILINFGSIKSKQLIRKSLLFLKSLNLNRSYKIIIIDNSFLMKNILDIKLKNKIIHYKFIMNIEEIYKKTFFTIGACGISLYERCFYNIPSISKCVAKNQNYNFKNFLMKKCILDFDKITKLPFHKSFNNDSFFKQINKVENNTKKYFDYKKNKKHLYNLFNKF